jgi:membrane-associated phospholipid phosphatase
MTTKKALLLSIATLILIAVSYFYADQAVAQWCHAHLTQSEKEIFLFITQFGESTFYLIGFALAALLLRFYWKETTWANRSLFLFASVAVSGIVVDIIKVIAGRYRPSELFEKGLYGFDFFHLDRALTSFPSGHTTTAFCLRRLPGYLASVGPVLWIQRSPLANRIAITALSQRCIGRSINGHTVCLYTVHYWHKI